MTFFSKRHPKKEEHITTKVGEGSFVTRVPFRIKKIEAVFSEDVQCHASCEQPKPDKLSIEIVEEGHSHGVVRIRWHVHAIRRIRYAIEG